MYQLRADFAILDQAQADQGAHAGNIDGLKGALMAHVARALDNFGAGIGTEEHQICMRKAEQLIDEYIAGTRQFQNTTGQVNQTFQSGAQRARAILASGA